MDGSDLDEDPVPPRNLFQKYNFTEEQEKLWEREVFSWGFEAAKTGKILKEVCEVPYLAKVYSEGYFTAKLLNHLNKHNK